MKEPRRQEHRRRSGDFDARLKERNTRRVRVTTKRGLGDAFAAMAESWGVDKTEDCGCTKRQRDWNAFGKKHPTIENIGVQFLAAITRKK
jgi:hypothetical protein